MKITHENVLTHEIEGVIDEDNKVIQFGYMNNKGEYTDIILKAYIEETQIPEDEMLRWLSGADPGSGSVRSLHRGGHRGDR